MGGTQSAISQTNENISDVVSVNQSTVLKTTGTTACTQQMTFDNCSIQKLQSIQHLTCLTDVAGYQKSMESQTSSNTLSNELMNQLTQSTQNASLNFTSQQEEVINNLKINMATDIQQSTLMDCNVSQIGQQAIKCDNSSINMVSLDQEAYLSQTSNCVQDSTENSTATQDLKNTVSNIMSQKVENALASCAAMILAIGCVVAIVFLGPGAEVGAISKNMVKEPAGILMMTFACVACVACCNAMTESNAHLFKCCGCSFPPKIPEKFWTEVWTGVFIYVFVMLLFAFYQQKHPAPTVAKK